MTIFIIWNVSCQDFPLTHLVRCACTCLTSCVGVEQRSLSSSKLHCNYITVDSSPSSAGMVQNLSMLFIFFFILTLILLPICKQSRQKSIFTYILATQVTLLGPRAGGSTSKHFAQRSEYMPTLPPKIVFPTSS